MNEKKRKVEIVFDSNARREYLIGFHKRKSERRKKAQEFMKKHEKKYRLRIRKDVRGKRNIEIQKYIKSSSLISQDNFLNLGNIYQQYSFENSGIGNKNNQKACIWLNKYDDQSHTTVTIEDLSRGNN